jgi:DNA-binding HxlR family transcriptional regulator
VVRELTLGPQRFSDLRAGLPAASPNVLSQRLRDLEAAGVVRRRKLPPPAASQVYELTEHGAELRPILTALGTWALRAARPPAGPVSAVSAMLTLQTYFSSPATGLVRVLLGERAYLARLAGGRAEVVPDDTSARADATVEAGPDTFVEVLTARRPVTAMTVTGDLATVEHMIAGIRMPGR